MGTLKQINAGDLCIAYEESGNVEGTMKRDFEDTEDIHQRIQTIPEELPIPPVRDAVIFPNAVNPLTVGREASVKLINDV